MPRAPAGEDRGKPEVKSKPEKMKRPEGMSREAFALLGGSNPVIPTHLLGEQLHSSWNIDINPAAQIATQLQILAGWSCVMRHLEQHCRSSSSSSKDVGLPDTKRRRLHHQQQRPTCSLDAVGILAAAMPQVCQKRQQLMCCQLVADVLRSALCRGVQEEGQAC